MVADHNQISGLDGETEQRHVLKLSHGIAIVLLFSKFDVTLSLELCIDLLFSSSLLFIPCFSALFP